MNITHIFKKQIFAICLIFVFAAIGIPQDLKSVSDGIEFATETYKLDGEPVSINLLKLDPKKVRLDVVHADDMAIGVEKTSDLAKRHNAIAAINGGFFRLDKSEFLGESAGVLMIDKKLLSESDRSRAAVFIRNEKKKTIINFLNLRLNEALRIGSVPFELSGINRELKDGETIKYTPEFGKKTPKNTNVFEITVVNGRIVDITKGDGEAEIPKGGFVLSASGATNEKLIKTARLNVKVMIGVLGVSKPTSRLFKNLREMQETHDIYTNAEDITNGVSRLLINGKVELTWERENANKDFAEKRHPRTAIGKLKDGTILLVTVDGRQPGHSVGMTLLEFAEYLKSIKVTDAINLDGGGSTTMFLDGKIVNRPSDKSGERSVGDAIIVTQRK